MGAGVAGLSAIGRFVKSDDLTIKVWLRVWEQSLEPLILELQQKNKLKVLELSSWKSTIKNLEKVMVKIPVLYIMGKRWLCQRNERRLQASSEKDDYCSSKRS